VTNNRHNLPGLIRLPGRRATTGVLVVALLVAAICWYLGANVWHSILLGVALTTLGLIGTVNADLNDTGWRGGGRSSRHGARREVDELSWSLRGSYGRVSGRAAMRVQQLARHRLALLSLDLRDPADRPRIEQLIGRRAYTVVAPGKRRPPLLRSLLHCLDVLDALDPTRPITSAGIGTRTPEFTSHLRRRARER
jgi:hypothetical protein